MFSFCPSARADVEVSMEDKVEVLLGKTAEITCMFTSADGIGGTSIRWYYVPQSASQDKQSIYYQDSIVTKVEKSTPFTDRISMNGTGATGQVVLSINDVQLTDEVEFICTIESLTEGTGEGRTKLRVFKAPELPTIEGVQRGISVHEDSTSKIGLCEVRNGYPRPNITWYKDNTPLHNIPDEVDVSSSTTSESSGLFSVWSELSMTVKKEDKDAQFYCEVTYFVPGATRMTESPRINVTVYYPNTAVKIWVESPKGQIKEGDMLELHCKGNGNSPSSSMTIKHLKDDNAWEGNGLLLENVTRRNSGLYECTSLDMESFVETKSNVSVFVNYLDPAVVTPRDSVVLDKGAELKATCNALSSLQTQTVWFKNGEKESEGHVLTLSNASFDTAGMYTCVVTVPEIEGMKTSGTLRLHVQGPPEIIKENNTVRETFEKNVQLSCRVRGYPPPTIIWTTADGKVLQKASQTKMADGAQSVVTVSSIMEVFCNASNEHGADTERFIITFKTKSNGVIIAVVIIFILLLAILGSVLYFLYKKGKICGRSGKQDLTKEKSSKDNIVVEMKSDNTEEAILLGVNGEKQPPGDQVWNPERDRPMRGVEYLRVQKGAADRRPTDSCS
ncbi:unnamed protein product [Menidia menidia]|uniref:(Atlantic silverside) hypothetical protein n=1 Tax=Menidia menidia TaxID=238744 RepID=A0A8S4BN95_9TELE|nr:unnamed protein product [Menidia menidia]